MLVEDTIEFMVKQGFDRRSIDRRYQQAGREYDMGYRVGEDRNNIGKDEYISERIIDLVDDLDVDVEGV